MWKQEKGQLAKAIGLSQKGVALVEEIFPEHSEKIVSSLSVITNDERDSLIKLLRKLGKVEL